LALVLKEQIQERRTAAEQDGEEQIGKPLAQRFIDEAAGAEGERAPVEMGDELGREEEPKNARGMLGLGEGPLEKEIMHIPWH
jgi:hypothetical protein